MAPKKPLPPLLSEYLLKKASVFSIYPNKDYSEEVSKLIDLVFQDLVEWRKTFEPKSATKVDLSKQRNLLDQFYSSDILRSVPDIVSRTLQLRQISFAGISDPEALVYLREAANCYIHGFFPGAIALARGALEAALKAKATRHHGAKDVKGLTSLKQLLDRYGGTHLGQEGLRSADLVRVKANAVLHENVVADAATTLRVFEAAREVVIRLSH